eukprot:gb/GECH01000820.1/.p1 GENE.gb/GECH01000820.1/~~gb/GECH01000820.1/.p1  ORF type:complete len:305 (+),score=82.32 gb/GECH01000820.1/:1-915(+)
MSGGTRCNVLPSHISPERFHTFSDRHRMHRILKAWPQNDQQRFFEKELGIPLSLEEETGKLFPTSNRARDVSNGLIGEATRRGVYIRTRTSMHGLRYDPQLRQWEVITDDNELLRFDRVILSSGGSSVINRDGRGFQVLRDLGCSLSPTFPALTPLLSSRKETHGQLSGLTLPDTIIRIEYLNNNLNNNIKKSENHLFFQHELEQKSFQFLMSPRIWSQHVTWHSVGFSSSKTIPIWDEADEPEMIDIDRWPKRFEMNYRKKINQRALETTAEVEASMQRLEAIVHENKQLQRQIKNQQSSIKS